MSEDRGRSEILLILADRFGAMSQGDKSCVVAMLADPDAQQLTTKDSAHGQFYEAMEELGWSEPVPLPPELEKLDFPALWTITPLGREHLASFMATVNSLGLTSEFEARRARELLLFGVKFIACYVAFQVAIFLVVFGLTRTGVDFGSFANTLSLMGIAFSYIASLTLTLRLWRAPSGDKASVLKSGYLVFLNRHWRNAVAISALAVVLAHLAFEGAAVMFHPSYTPPTAMLTILRIVALGAATGAIGWVLVPRMLLERRARLAKQ